VNISGLVIGLASALLLLSYVSFQYGYDSSHIHRKDIYRVDLSFYENNQQVFQSAENYPGLAPALKEEIPEVADAARLYNMGYKNNCVFTYKNQSFREKKFMYADASFLSIFSFPFLKGDVRTALSHPFAAVISESFAKKVFGKEDPMGKPIKMDDDDRHADLCQVTGVFKDIPQDSHLHFNILISYNTLDARPNATRFFEESWGRKDFYTYVQLRPGVNPIQVQSRLSGLVDKYRPEEKTTHTKSIFSLQPLSKIHLTPGFIDEAEPAGNEKAMSFLIIIAFFIMAIAWVNYVNMTTAGSVNRAKEIGIRKVMGSRKIDLIRQFLIESLTINGISTLAALGLIAFLRPAIDGLLGIHFAMTTLFHSPLGWSFAACILLGTLLSGLYPAFVLSSFTPIAALKGKIKAHASGIFLRRAGRTSILIVHFSHHRHGHRISTGKVYAA
jgi:putative ABC transport system permease protein